MKDENEENNAPPLRKMYQPSAVWRRDRAIAIMFSTCALLEAPVSEEQTEHLRQILFDALRLYLQANQEIKPGCMSLIFPLKLGTHYQEMSDHADRAWELMERLMASPQEYVSILEKLDHLFPK